MNGIQFFHYRVCDFCGTELKAPIREPLSCTNPECVPTPSVSPSLQPPAPMVDAARYADMPHPWYQAPRSCRCLWCVEVRIPAQIREDTEWALAKMETP